MRLELRDLDVSWSVEVIAHLNCSTKKSLWMISARPGLLCQDTVRRAAVTYCYQCLTEWLIEENYTCSSNEV